MTLKLINPALPAATIVGTAVCPIASLLGYDADGSRANQLNDGRVFSVFNGFSYPIEHGVAAAFAKLPDAMKNVVLSLIRKERKDEFPFRLASIQEGSGVGAVAQGFGPDDIATTIVLTRTPVDADACPYKVERIEITFTGNDLKSAAKSDEKVGADNLSRCSFPVPGATSEAFGTLVKQGFRLVHADAEGIAPRLVMVKGYRLPGKPTILGVRAQLSWSLI